MRPLELEIAGFRSHYAPTKIDFTHRNLLAIVGPIGAGKSSILDAICFALYRRTPKIQKEQKRLICSRSDAAHVRLRFSVDGSEHEITRSLPRKGNGEHVLVDLATGDKVIGATDVTDRVEELLGLSFDAFRSSILLAQGQFAEFLHAPPDARTKILKGVFRFDQISALHQAAQAHLASARNDVAGVEGELRGLPADAAELMRTEREALAKIGRRIEKLITGAGKETGLLEAMDEARRVERDGKARADGLEQALGTVPEEGALARVLESARRRDEAVAAAMKGLARAEEALAKVTEERERLEKELGREEALRASLRTAEELAEVRREISELSKQRDSLGERVAQASEVAEAATAAEEAADADAEAAAQRVAAAERADIANTLRGHLHAGDDCPVCEQQIVKPPPVRSDPELDRARAALVAANEARTRARVAGKKAQEALTRTREELKALDSIVDKTNGRAEKLADEVRRHLGDGDDPGAEARARLKRLEDASAAVSEARVSADEARAEATTAEAERTEVARSQREIAAALLRIADKTGVEVPDLDCSAEELVECANRARIALDKSLGEARADADKAKKDLDKTTTALRLLRTELEVDVEQTLAAALAAARAEEKYRTQRVAEIEQQAARAVELEAELAKLGSHAALYERLVVDLRDTNFVNFLLEDRRHLLSELGSEYLREMTSRYRFSDDAEFDIIDELDADKRRDVETLSGGETFLAALALSLALAEAVTREGGRLESFFLDEGFGSLDDDAFDHALDGIEKIVVSDRLIGLVSHVPALRARIEDKIVLERSAEGVTRVVAGATR